MDGNNFMKYLAMESENERYGFVSDKTGPISSGNVKRFKDEAVESKNMTVELASEDETELTIQARRQLTMVFIFTMKSLALVKN